jgi:fatty-acyl-CoA synthase
VTSRCRTLGRALGDAADTAEGFVFAAGATERRRSYQEIYAASSRVAGALQAMGLGRGDLVALIVSDPEQFLTSLFGASMAGVVPASVYPPAATADLSHYLAATASILRSARARAIVTRPSLAAAMETLRPVCPDLRLVITSDDLAASDVPHVAMHAGPDDIAFVQFTSGSTSEPKGVIVTHCTLAANIEAINGPAGLATTPADSAVSWLPLYHDMGLVGMALGALYSARPAVLMTPETFVKRPAEWLRAISRHRATVSFAPNFAYDLSVRRMKDRDLVGIDLSSWRVAGCGGEPIHAGTLAAFAAKFQPAGFRATSFLPSYGLAEHVLAATFPPRGRPVRVARLSDYGEVVSCGFPLPGHDLRIVGEDGARVGDGTIGQIELSGPSVMAGYYGDHELTAQTIRDGWLLTGDLGFVDGGELFVCGRTKDVLVVNGRKHHPQDLEWAVDELPGIRRGRVAAFGVAGQGVADRIVMIVEPSGTVALDALEQAVRQRVRDVCGLYVDEVVLVSSGTIGRTTSGKVQRAATKHRYEIGEIVDCRLKVAE